MNFQSFIGISANSITKNFLITLKKFPLSRSSLYPRVPSTMSTTGSTTTLYNYTIFHSSRSRSRCRSRSLQVFNRSCCHKKGNDKCHFPGNQSSLSLKTTSSKTKTDVGVRSSVEPGHPLPSDPFPGSWKIWILGMVVTLILPFWKNKWGPLQKFKKEVDRAEEVVEMIEKVAEDVEKVADDIGDHLPEGTKLRKAASFIENIAKETVEAANQAEQFIDKVEDVEKDAESFTDRTGGQSS